MANSNVFEFICSKCCRCSSMGMCAEARTALFYHSLLQSVGKGSLSESSRQAAASTQQAPTTPVSLPTPSSICDCWDMNSGLLACTTDPSPLPQAKASLNNNSKNLFFKEWLMFLLILYTKISKRVLDYVANSISFCQPVTEH